MEDHPFGYIAENTKIHMKEERLCRHYSTPISPYLALISFLD